ncbi:MAG TPA: two-component regulator propeller domain-containing protein, partial [Saprospiraceae bacterium]|nr:two-component regulator propeller domain-containing protein [Saprospiraceae bacterium]
MTAVFFKPLKLLMFRVISKLNVNKVLHVFGLCTFWMHQLHSQNPHFQAFGITSGLERPDVSCVFQDSRGLLWVGTSGAGLYQFVQSRFSQVATTPDATGYTIRQIGEDKAGFLYLLSELGLIRYDGRDFLTLADHAEHIKGFAINHSGVWWATVDSLFLQKASGNVLKKSLSADLLIPDVDKEDRLLVVNEKEVSFIDDELQESEAFPVSGKLDREWVSCTYDADSTLWIISHKGQLLQFDGFGFALVNTSLTQASCIAAGALGSLWIAGSQGISIYQPQDSSLISLQLGSPANCLYFDNIDRLWIGTPSDGLLRYFGDQHREWEIPDDENVQKIFPGETADSSWLLLRSGILMSLGNSSHQITSPHTKGEVRQSYQDKLSRLWALTEESLWMYHDTSWILMDSSSISQRAEIVGSDHRGNIWISDTSTLLRYGIKPMSFPIGISFAAEKVQGKLPADKTIAILTDRQGKVLRIGGQSVGHLMHDRYEQTHQMMGYHVLSADLDAEGMLWLGTEGAGIFRMIPERGQLPRPLKTTYPLRVSDIVFIRNTENGLIAGTDRTLLRMHTDTSGLHVTRVDVLNKESGIPLIHLGVDQYAVTTEGNVLVVAKDEVVEFELSRSDAIDDVPTIFISQVLINGMDIRDTKYGALHGPFCQQLQMPVFSASESSFTFVFNGNSVEDEYLSYQWRL